MKPKSSNPWSNDVFAAAWDTMQSTWNTFALTLGTLHLLLLIDVLNGSQFMSAGGGIDIGDFKIVRETLSITYGLLFAFFISKALLESRVVRDLCAGEVDGSISAAKTKAVLWTVSPFSACSRMQKFFWFLLMDGFILLAIFSAIHLLNIREFPFLSGVTKAVTVAPGDPLPTSMGTPAYVGIGVVDLLLLLLCLRRCREIVENLRFIRAKFTAL